MVTSAGGAGCCVVAGAGVVDVDGVTGVADVPGRDSGRAVVAVLLASSLLVTSSLTRSVMRSKYTSRLRNTSNVVGQYRCMRAR